jgi:hypothetical protein|eukprot:SAG25_NODE_819_length_5219_cov_37.174219_5_plen_423_part_00
MSDDEDMGSIPSFSDEEEEAEDKGLAMPAIVPSLSSPPAAATGAAARVATTSGALAAPGGEEALTEIDDFTCASSWESFIAAIEAALRSWFTSGAPPQARSNSAGTGTEPYRVQHLSAPWNGGGGDRRRDAVGNGGAMEVMLVHVRLRPADLGNRTADEIFDDWPEEPGLLRQPIWGLHEALRLCAYFGAREYILLRPASKQRRIVPELASWLLSSALVACRAVDVPLPALYVPTGTPADAAYIGGSASPPSPSPDTRAMFQRCASAPPCATPPAARMRGAATTHLNYLLSMFERKRAAAAASLAAEPSTGEPPRLLTIEAAARFMFRTVTHTPAVVAPPTARCPSAAGGPSALRCYTIPGLEPAMGSIGAGGWGAGSKQRWSLRTRCALSMLYLSRFYLIYGGNVSAVVGKGWGRAGGKGV